MTSNAPTTIGKHLLFLALSLCVAACNPTPPSPHLAHVRMWSVNHTVVFNRGTRYMSGEQVASLKRFVGDLPASAVSDVIISANGKDKHTAARVKAMKRYLMHNGIAGNAIHILPAQGGDARRVLLAVRYSQAVPPAGCPDWSKDSLIDYNSTGSSNFGCAYNADLAGQVADPADLDRGHGKPEFDGTRDSAILQKYMSGTSSAASSGSASGASSASTSSASPASPSP